MKSIQFLVPLTSSDSHPSFRLVKEAVLSQRAPGQPASWPWTHRWALPQSPAWSISAELSRWPIDLWAIVNAYHFKPLSFGMIVMWHYLAIDSWYNGQTRLEGQHIVNLWGNGFKTWTVMMTTGASQITAVAMEMSKWKSEVSPPPLGISSERGQTHSFFPCCWLSFKVIAHSAYSFQPKARFSICATFKS